MRSADSPRDKDINPPAIQNDVVCTGTSVVKTPYVKMRHSLP